jgi:hypothetical protein
VRKIGWNLSKVFWVLPQSIHKIVAKISREEGAGVHGNLAKCGTITPSVWCREKYNSFGAVSQLAIDSVILLRKNKRLLEVSY